MGVPVERLACLKSPLLYQLSYSLDRCVLSGGYYLGREPADRIAYVAAALCDGHPRNTANSERPDATAGTRKTPKPTKGSLGSKGMPWILRTADADAVFYPNRRLLGQIRSTVQAF